MVQVNPTSSSYSVAVSSTSSTNSVSSSSGESASMYWAMQSKAYAESILNDAGFIAVSEDLTNINIVKDDLTNIDIVATDLALGDSSNIKIVVNDKAKIDNVSDNMSAITTANSNIMYIRTCSNNIYSIQTCANNITTISNKVNKTGDTMVGDLNLKNKYVIVDSIPSIQYSRLCFVEQTGDIAFSMRGACDYNEGNNNPKNRYFYLTAKNYGGDSYAVCFQYNETTSKYYIDVDSDIQNSITNWSFPSISSHAPETITIGTPGFTYTAPADGFINLEIATNGTDGWIKIAYDGIEYQSSQATAYGNSSILVPVRKGAIATISYGAPGSGNDTSGWTWVKHHFIYAIGG